MFVKICGLSDERGVEAALDAGADAIGFVFAKSAREVSPERARELCRDVTADTVRVAVMHHPGTRRYSEVIAAFDPDWIQTDVEDFAALTRSERPQPLPVFREDATGSLTEFPPRLLFEGRTSGSGETADWAEARRISERTELILAGGLHVGNVAAAIASVRPFGVDVSSGVESERGKKDPEKIKAFVARVRALELEP